MLCVLLKTLWNHSLLLLLTDSTVFFLLVYCHYFSLQKKTCNEPYNSIHNTSKCLHLGALPGIKQWVEHCEVWELGAWVSSPQHEKDLRMGLDFYFHFLSQNRVLVDFNASFYDL